jgi:hypothetical protein
VLLALVLAGTALAQQSASFKLEEHVLNSGGNPDAAGSILTSANFRISLDSLGQGIVAQGLSSASFRLDSGFPEAYAPADEVTGLLFADKNNLEWDPEKSGMGRVGRQMRKAATTPPLCSIAIHRRATIKLRAMPRKSAPASE